MMKIVLKMSFMLFCLHGQAQTNIDNEKEDLSTLDSLNHIYIPKNLEECFIQIDSFLHDTTKTQMKNLEEGEFSNRQHFGLGLWMRNNWGLWGGSRLAKFFNNRGIYHPDDMSGIILDSYHRKLNNKQINLEEQIKIFADYWEKAKEGELKKQQKEKLSAEKNLKWLSDRKIPILKLFKVDSKYVKMTCDSTLIIKNTDKDSIFLWTSASESYYGEDPPFSYKSLESDIKNKYFEFGKLSYIRGLNYQGNIAFVTLKRNVFKISKDSLFELDEFYKINNDSVAYLEKKAFNIEGNKRDLKKYSKILSQNRFYKFKLIYCKSMFQDSSFVYFNAESKDTVRLTGLWEVGTKKYYRVTIENKTANETKTSYSYRIDDLYRFVDYEGCDKLEMEAISSDKNLIKTEEDE